MGVFRPSDIETNALEEIGCEGWNWDNLLRYMKKVTTHANYAELFLILLIGRAKHSKRETGQRRTVGATL